MATDPRSVFTAELRRLVRRNMNLGSFEATTTTGHTVRVTGMASGHVGALAITTPDGRTIRRADGWKIAETGKVAEFLWDELELERARAAERKRLEGLKSVSITAVNAVGGAAGRQTSRYQLTPEQLAQLLAQAEEMAAGNIAAATAK
ncbi:hypothetical protein OG458_41605 (plasmid) [Streptomyces sp. NBC_01281]|uniref:hypothetical protein n=1 Tax=Streptomyces sp. NBC_01281 TaxID=2903811 RepID=UPI002E10393F|nr:hypothetical protein OG458_41605 [Streptomyces sp. NBC_01281]